MLGVVHGRHIISAQPMSCITIITIVTTTINKHLPLLPLPIHFLPSIQNDLLKASSDHVTQLLKTCPVLLRVTTSSSLGSAFFTTCEEGTLCTCSSLPCTCGQEVRRLIQALNTGCNCWAGWLGGQMLAEAGSWRGVARRWGVAHEGTDLFPLASLLLSVLPLHPSFSSLLFFSSPLHSGTLSGFPWPCWRERHLVGHFVSWQEGSLSTSVVYICILSPRLFPSPHPHFFQFLLAYPDTTAPAR